MGLHAAHAEIVCMELCMRVDMRMAKTTSLTLLLTYAGVYKRQCCTRAKPGLIGVKA